MKKIILILTSCGTATNLTDSVKNKMKNWGKNPCYNEETKIVDVGCKK